MQKAMNRTLKISRLEMATHQRGSRVNRVRYWAKPANL
jgi:hypothetical protein